MPVDRFADFAIWYVVFLFTLTVHEGAHALVALWGGDRTAYQGGQVTFNPWPHIRREPFGTVVVPLFTFFASGWMMGWASTPYDPIWGRRHPGRQAAMSAAGPAANVLLAGLSLAILRILLAGGYFVVPGQLSFSRLVEPPAGTASGSIAWGLALFLSVALNLNVLLAIFNLIPLPPLDGSGVIQGLFPGSAGRLYDGVARNPAVSLLGMVIAWRVMSVLYPPAFRMLVALLHPGIDLQ